MYRYFTNLAIIHHGPIKKCELREGLWKYLLMSVLICRNVWIWPSYCKFMFIELVSRSKSWLMAFTYSLCSELDVNWLSLPNKLETLKNRVSPFHEISKVVVLIYLNQDQCLLITSVSTVHVWEIGHLTSAAFGNVTSSHFSHSNWRAGGLSSWRPRERDVHLFLANENGSPPFLLESCHIDSIHRQTK